MSSPQRKIPLAFDWGTKVSPGRNGSPARHQWHTWKYNFAVNSHLKQDGMEDMSHKHFWKLLKCQ
jgi:hypothetical protein